MALVIRASSFFTKRYLKVTDWGVDFMETAALGGRRKFAYGQIDFVLMSPSFVLSFQVGNEVFSIQTKPQKFKQQQAIEQLKTMVAASQQQSVGFPVTPIARR